MINADQSDVADKSDTAGFSGSAPIACGGGTIGDLFSERDRASAMALYSLGPLVGPAVGPVAGGFISEKIGPKYVFIVIAGMQRLDLVFSMLIATQLFRVWRLVSAFRFSKRRMRRFCANARRSALATKRKLSISIILRQV